MNVKAFFFLLMALSINTRVYSQVDTIKPSKHILYLEIAGIGGYGSVNLERTFYQKSWVAFSARMGLGTYHLRDFLNKFNPDIIIPFSLFGCLGKKHKMELSVGQVFSSIVHFESMNNTSQRIIRSHSNFGIGYRYQKNTAGIFFRLVYSPIIENNRTFRNWGGLSVGYTF